MSLDVSDPHISMAYDALAQNDPLRWFLLAYGNRPNKLSLCASGTGDLEELRAHITPGNVHYGVFREHNNNAPVCISLAVIPDSVGGVRRARALVHARTISSMFKTHQALNASNPEQITYDALRSVLHHPPRTAAAPIPDPATTLSSQIDSGWSPPSRVDSRPSPPSQYHFATPAPTPSSSNHTSNTTPPQTRSHRKPPPRLSMPPTARSPPSAREHPPEVPSQQTRAEPSPPMPHSDAPSPRAPYSPVASSPATNPASSPPLPQSSHSAMADRSPAASPPSPITPESPTISDVLASGDLSAQASWLAKQEAPLPAPPPPHADPVSDPESEHEHNARPSRAPKSAFESDDESESDHSIPMHGPLAEIGKPDPAAAPASPIGSIPDTPSVASRPSPKREPSSGSLREPSPPVHINKGRPTVDIPTNGTSTAPRTPAGASALRTPAQEEAYRARGEWAEQERVRTPVNDVKHSPPPSAKQHHATSPPPTTEKSNEEPPRVPAKSPIKRRGTVPAGQTDGITARTTATAASAPTGEAPITPPANRDPHRRGASQDMYKSSAPPQTRSRLLERASPEMQEEERRLAVLDEERRRRAAERAQREREERAEEEARERAFEERKERERVRRIELARLAEARREEARQREAEARAELEAREAREKEVRATREKQARAHVRQHTQNSGPGMELLSGFVTLEMASVWRRRYFRLSTDSWQFFRNDKDVAQPVHVIELARVRGLREWNEGYEELEAIPHSFAVELTDDGPWQFFADSAEDKEILLGLLNQAAGL